MLEYRLHPLGFIHAVSDVQGPEAVSINRVKSPLGWPGTATSALAQAHEEGAGTEQSTVSAKAL